MALTNCKRCLLKDISKEEYFKNVYEYISQLSDEIKASDEVYNSRLDECKKCDKLINGMCSLCGCFVETRAAKRLSCCPDTPKHWESCQTDFD